MGGRCAAHRGVAALIAGLSPRGGVSHVRRLTWVIGIAVPASGSSWPWQGDKAMTHALLSGIFGVLASWSTCAMVVVGVGGMFLMQNALQASRLATAQPGITLLDPVTAIVWGTLAFHEHTHGGFMLILAVGGAIIMAIGAVMLSRSKTLAEGIGAGTKACETARGSSAKGP